MRYDQIRSFCVNKWKLPLWCWLLPFAISINHLRLNWIRSEYRAHKSNYIISNICLSVCVFVCIRNRNINTQRIQTVQSHSILFMLIPRTPNILFTRTFYLHLMAFSICDSIAYFFVNVQCPMSIMFNVWCPAKSCLPMWLMVFDKSFTLKYVIHWMDWHTW